MHCNLRPDGTRAFRIACRSRPQLAGDQSGRMRIGAVGDFVSGVAVVGRPETTGSDTFFEFLNLQFLDFKFVGHVHSLPFYCTLGVLLYKDGMLIKVIPRRPMD